MGVDGGRRRTRWIALAVGGVLALAVAAAFSLVPDEPPAPGVQVAEGFPAVLPPSFDGPPTAPSPAASLSPSPARKPGRSASPAASGGPAATSPPLAKAPGEPIAAYSACSAQGAVTFTATYTQSFAYRHVFIDRDTKASTGYQVPELAGGFGADYMIENDVLYESTGADWSWQEVEGVSPLQSVSGGAYRWRLKPAHGSGRVVFNGSDGDSTDERYTSVVTVKAC